MYTTHRKMRGKLTPRTAKVWPSLATTAHDRRRRAAPLPSLPLQLPLRPSLQPA